MRQLSLPALTGLAHGVSDAVAGENAAKIVGIPQQRGTFSFTLDVWCFGTNLPGQSGNKAYTIVVE